MKITGIVIEYNPFHYGHHHHIKEAIAKTNPDVVVGVMSGHFVQRGEMAITDKWQRTQVALEHGVDLVLELPTLYALQSAQEFANGALAILDKALVNDLVFGSESNDLATIKEIAELPINANHLKEAMKLGHSYPKALSLVAGEYYPNDILGIAYAKAALNTNITLHSILRTNQYHSEDLDDTFASATALRQALKNKQDVSGLTPMTNLSTAAFLPSWEAYYPLLKYKLLSTPKEHLQEILLVSEGIENHLVNMASQHTNFKDFINASTSRRYSKARIQRICAHILLNTKKEFALNYPKEPSLRVLGFNQQGLKALQLYKEKEIKVATRFNQLPKMVREYEHRVTSIYALPFNTSTQTSLIAREVGPPIMLLDKPNPNK